ncbi:MAG: arsenate reductase ArsC [Chloroflexi bacterium]|nr:arsenate reductase ArsC [Chloroflexota bacterium]
MPDQRRLYEMSLPTRKLTVLILCTANSARSQMAEGLLRELAAGRADVYSAGAQPSHVNPYAIEAMRQRGIDISGQSSHHLSKYLGTEFDYVITVCDNAAETCPVFPGRAARIHWSFPDPTAVSGAGGDLLGSFIKVRDGLERRLQQWLSSLS